MGVSDIAHELNFLFFNDFSALTPTPLPKGLEQLAQRQALLAKQERGLSAEWWWCPKKYAASNVPVIDIEKTDGKCLEVIKHLLGKAAGFTHRAAYPVAQAAVITQCRR